MNFFTQSKFRNFRETFILQCNFILIMLNKTVVSNFVFYFKKIFILSADKMAPDISQKQTLCHLPRGCSEM